MTFLPSALASFVIACCQKCALQVLQKSTQEAEAQGSRSSSAESCITFRVTSAAKTLGSDVCGVCSHESCNVRRPIRHKRHGSEDVTLMCFGFMVRRTLPSARNRVSGGLRAKLHRMMRLSAFWHFSKACKIKSFPKSQRTGSARPCVLRPRFPRAGQSSPEPREIGRSSLSLSMPGYVISSSRFQSSPPPGQRWRSWSGS